MAKRQAQTGGRKTPAKTSKKATSKEIAVVEHEAGSLQVADNPQAGMITLDQEDIMIPRLLIGQLTSEEVADETCEVSFGDIYENFTAEVLGKSKDKKASIEIFPLQEFKSRLCYTADKNNIQDYVVHLADFGHEPDANDLMKGGKILCRSQDYVNGKGFFEKDSAMNPTGICADCPMSQWRHNPQTGDDDLPPICSAMYNFYVMVRGGDPTDIFVLSFGKTSYNIGKKWKNQIAKFQRRSQNPMWANIYTLSTTFHNPDPLKKWFQWAVAPGGKTTPDEIEAAVATWHQLQNANIQIVESDEVGSEDTAPDM